MYGWMPTGVRHNEIENLIQGTRRSMDLDNDGKISYKERVHWSLHKEHPSRYFCSYEFNDQPPWFTCQHWIYI